MALRLTPRVIQRRRLLLGGLALGFAALCAVAAATQLGAQRTFRTHRDTVEHALAQRSIAHADIRFSQSIEDRNNLLFFRASVEVLLPDGSIAYGWIGCESRESGCLLDIRSLGLRGVALPELTPSQPNPWLAWAEGQLRAINWRGLLP